MRKLTHLLTLAVFMTGVLALGGCKYYGGALPPENPISMDEALNRTSNRAPVMAADGTIMNRPPRPAIDRPSYLPEKELAVVAPPKTLLVWTYPHVADDNTRVFGNWATIFLTDRYEWVLPANEQPAADQGGGYGGP